MSKPNIHCGECPYWLAYGDSETTDEQRLAIRKHCAKCELDFDPVAAEYLDRMMRAARKQIVWYKARYEENT
jgi:hypothetical protein